MPLVVQNWYFIRRGMEEEGLATRARASDVRARDRRPVGRILIARDQGPTIPTFIWECEYRDQEARDADLAWADASPEFGAVRRHMATLLDRFERISFEIA